MKSVADRSTTPWEAEAGGADRVELNSSIFLGGLTPTLGSLVAAKKRLSIPVITMIRPRGGGFCYSESEIEAMLHDTRLAVENGTDGIVFGILKPDGTVDEVACEKLIFGPQAGPRSSSTAPSMWCPIRSGRSTA